MYLQNTSRSNLRNALNAAGTVEAWDNHAFVDLAANISGDSISVLGVQRGDSQSEANRLGLDWKRGRPGMTSTANGH